MIQRISIVLAFILPSFLGLSQDEKGAYFGINGGAYFANKNTAMMYSGGNNFSLYGIEWAFNNAYYKPDFDAYFQYPYSIVELPEGMKYRPSIEIGGIAGVNSGAGTSMFAEVNVAKLDVKDVFVVGVENPHNNTGTVTYEQIPIFGEEQRLNVNVGGRFPIFESNGLRGYVPIFGNFNSVKLERNYFVVNNKQYNIVHNIQGITNERPGGIGFGAGSGLAVNYRVNDSFLLEVSYNLYYSKITMQKSIGFVQWGVQNSFSFRVIWG